MSPTRRELLGAAVAAVALPLAPEFVAADTRPDPFVLMNTRGPGWSIHLSDDQHVQVEGVNIGCTSDGEWWMGIKTGDMELPADILIDEPDAIAFLRTFVGMLIDPPAEMPGRHTLSELRAERD